MSFIIGSTYSYEINLVWTVSVTYVFTFAPVLNSNTISVFHIHVRGIETHFIH